MKSKKTLAVLLALSFLTAWATPRVARAQRDREGAQPLRIEGGLDRASVSSDPRVKVVQVSEELARRRALARARLADAKIPDGAEIVRAGEPVAVDTTPGSTAATSAPIRYDSFPSVGGAFLVDTNGSFPSSHNRAGDDYTLSNLETLTLTTFTIRLQVFQDSGAAGGVIIVSFWTVDFDWVGAFTTTFPTIDVANWVISLPFDFKIPGKGYWRLSTADGSNGADSTAGLFRSNSVAVGFNDPTVTLLDDNVVGDHLTSDGFGPDILAFKMEGNSFIPQLEHVSTVDCCGKVDCSDAPCRAKVTAIDPGFCDPGWDGICGAEAGWVCPDLCQSKSRHISVKIPAITAGTLRTVKVTPIKLYDPRAGCPARPPGSPSLSNRAFEDLFPLFMAIGVENGLPGADQLFFSYPGCQGPNSVLDASSTPDRTIHIRGPDILPCSYYKVSLSGAFGGDCSIGDPACYSTSIRVSTGLWGDVLPTGVVNVFDITSVVDSLKLIPTAPTKVFAKMGPRDIPAAANVTVTDIVLVVDAVKLGPYPFDGPDVCP